MNVDKSEIFSHYSKVLDQLLTHDFFKTYFQAPYSIDESVYVDNIELHCGATRGCIIGYDYDYVVKYDIVGNYCEQEVNIYEAAEDAGLNQYLAEPMYIGTYTKQFQFYSSRQIETEMTWYDYDEEDFNNRFKKIQEDLTPCPVIIEIPLYAYPRADELQRGCGYSPESERSARSYTGPLRDKQLCVAASFIEEYGINECYRISDFFLDWDVGDLHLGNVGIINHHFCFIDYAGYHEED